MSESLDPQHKEVICPAITEKAQEGVVKLQDVLNSIEDYIVLAHDHQLPLRAFRGIWTKRINDCTALLNMKENVSWNAIERRLRILQHTEENDNGSNTTTTTTTNSSNSMKKLLSPEDKEAIRRTYNSLDQRNCWILDATRDLAASRGEEPESVEYKMMTFALSCNDVHPAHSMILDLKDPHWRDVFTEAEIKELHSVGQPITRPLPSDLTEQLDSISQLKTATDAYQFAQRLEHDPTTQPLLAWVTRLLRQDCWVGTSIRATAAACFNKLFVTKCTISARF